MPWKSLEERNAGFARRREQRKPKHGPDCCTVYFIQVGDDGPIKIGQTKRNPIRRLDALQTGMPFNLKLLAVLWDAPLYAENRLHYHFAELRIRGEWFRPEKPLLDFIEQYAAAWCPPERVLPKLSDLPDFLRLESYPLHQAYIACCRFIVDFTKDPDRYCGGSQN